MRTTARLFCVASALTLFASPAAAQFTGVVAPPKRPAEPAVAETTPGTRTDSTGRTALTDMRAWVDSAAGVTAPEVARADSVARAREEALPTDTSLTWRTAGGEVRTGDPVVGERGPGMRAPDTATGAPTFALLGLGMLGAGAWLLRRRGRA